MKAKHKVLVVDDQKLNIRVLERKLEQNGIRVLTAMSGAEGLRIAEESKPHVILLDIMMPEMDGLEVCRRLKANPDTAEIPVVFITARNSKEGKIEGLNFGAADYLTKPIDLDETLARVRTQIRIQESHKENLILTKRLEEARRQAAMVHLTEGIAHNLNNMLGVATGYLDLVKAHIGNPENLKTSCGKLDMALKRIAKIVHELTSIGQFDSVQTGIHSVNAILESAIIQLRDAIDGEVDIQVENQLEDSIQIETNPELLASAIERVGINAFESYTRLSAPPVERPIRIGVTVSEVDHLDMLCIAISDEGSGIPDNIKENVFDPFVSTESTVGRGMGLTMARHSLRNMGGDIDLKSKEGKGTTVRLLHPLPPVNDPGTSAP